MNDTRDNRFVDPATGEHIRCLRCNGSRREHKKPNRPVERCYWCDGTGWEPVEGGRA